MKRKFLTLLFVLIGVSMYSQQDSQFTQYMYNTININPAYAGTRGVLSIFGLHRNQWVGLDGAPVTNALSLNSPIENTNIGLGLSFINDKIGPADENSISVDISYSIKTSEAYKLSFGVKGTANLFNVDLIGKTTQFDLGDKLLYNVDNKFSPNIGVGAYWHSDKTYFGLSVPNILETQHYKDDVKSSIASERMHIYFISGRVFDLSSSLKLKPALLTKMVKGAPLQVDLSANFLYNEKFTLGAAYRWSAALSLMAGFQISDSLFAGYAYDLETTRLGNYNSGSHEIFLRYELFKNYDKIVSPRFF
ncbi:type IX secretion system membrane protein PorP/SprF [Flavobacterium sp.]|uniref:PorP/SprF family type IX secretion system membrane protein n=1 Tax=Flavobacterium sp. TaxID=239 RepID=UPI00374CFDAE